MGDILLIKKEKNIGPTHGKCDQEKNNLAPTTREINKEESIQGINLQSDRHWAIYA